MYRSSAILMISAGLVASAQDAGQWQKFGNSSGDQSYSMNQVGPAQNTQGAPAPSYAPGYAPSQATLPAGTFVVVRINEKLSSDHNQPGDFFTATLERPLIANGLVIAEPGQNVAGRVSEALNADRGRGTSRLGLELTELSLVDGQQVPIRTQLMEYQRGNSDGRDVGVVAGTTAAGAAIGAVAGGGVGAGIGAIGGAVAGAIGVMATRAHSTEIHPEAILTFRTVDPVAIAMNQSGGAFQPVRQQDYQTQAQQPQPRQRAIAPPGPGYYGGYYGGYYPYDPFFYGYGYGPYFGGGFYYRSGPRVIIRGGGGRRR